MNRARRTISLSLWIIIGGAFLGYTYIQTQNLTSGPGLTISSPIPGTTYTESLISVTGETTNVSHLTLNDRPIFMDEKGQFGERLLLAPGYNIITVTGTDKFDTVIKEHISLFYQAPLADPVLQSPGTTTPIGSS